jgi:hypothetical protein
MKVTAKSWFAATLGLIFIAITASAQTRFVQITDPHVFDADQPTRYETLGKSKQKARVLDAERAFRGALLTINAQIAAGAKYEFIVITGDLGVAHLHRPVGEAAKRMASWLRVSKVDRFLFVPGNNDVGNSQERIDNYKQFLASLKKLLPNRIVDLCEQPLIDSQGRLFIGHNTASYKSDLERHMPDLLLLRERISAASRSVSQIYLFVHIAGVDDPHLIEIEKPDPKQPEFPYSSWGVNGEVRQAWHSLLAESSVKGLFAGHFHSSNRSFYQRPLTWVRGRYPKEVVEKTFLCPPLSAKYQWDRSSRARGFQIVTLDQEGRPSVQIYWYNNGQFSE